MFEEKIYGVTVTIGASTFTGATVVESALILVIPSKTNPFLPSIVTSEFSFNVVVAEPVPTTQGIPNSREIIDAWHVTPPSSVQYH